MFHCVYSIYSCLFTNTSHYCTEMLNIYQGISCPKDFLRLLTDACMCVPMHSATSLKEFPQDFLSDESLLNIVP